MRLINGIGGIKLCWVVPRGRFRIYHVYSHVVDEGGIRMYAQRQQVNIGCYDKKDYDFLIDFFTGRGYSQKRSFIQCENDGYPDFPHPLYERYVADYSFRLEMVDKEGFDQCVSELRDLGYHCMLRKMGNKYVVELVL